jgi:hypothetical protein
LDEKLPKAKEPTRIHITRWSWTEADINRLKVLSSQGASIVRAAASLNRKTSAVAKIARLHGIWQLKAAIRALGPQASFSVNH